MFFEVVGPVSGVQVIARGTGVKARARLNRQFGPGAWRKLKGRALVQLPNGTRREAEVHWYEAQGIGKRNIKIKRFLD